MVSIDTLSSNGCQERKWLISISICIMLLMYYLTTCSDCKKTWHIRVAFRRTKFWGEEVGVDGCVISHRRPEFVSTVKYLSVKIVITRKLRMWRNTYQSDQSGILVPLWETAASILLPFAKRLQFQQMPAALGALFRQMLLGQMRLFTLE